MKTYKHKTLGWIAEQCSNKISYDIINELYILPSGLIENSLDWELQVVKREPLFTTEDGVDIYEEDSHFKVADDWLIYKSDITTEVLPNKGKRIFSTKEAAKQYVLMNKPMFSLNELFSGINNLAHSNRQNSVWDFFENEAKEKLNKHYDKKI